MNICMFCLKEGGHTQYCEELRKKPANSMFTVQYHCLRATMSSYKAEVGEANKHLAPMWDKSATFWCEGAAQLINRAQIEGLLKELRMPEA